jgi:hypothetical protein
MSLFIPRMVPVVLVVRTWVRTVSTIGNQKETNYALRADMTEEEFIKVTDGLLPPLPILEWMWLWIKRIQSFETVLTMEWAINVTDFEVSLKKPEL